MPLSQLGATQDVLWFYNTETNEPDLTDLFSLIKASAAKWSAKYFVAVTSKKFSQNK